MVSKHCQTIGKHELLPFLEHNRLPQQKNDLLKISLISAQGAYYSKTARWIFIINFWLAW